VKFNKLTAAILLIPVMILVMGSLGVASAAPLTVMKSGSAQYLADSNGMTLYYFTKDTGGASTCAGQCLERWPIFYTDNVMVPTGMDAKEFGVITRADGKKQNTFRGWPIYYWAGDKIAGQTSGQGFNGVWFYITNPLSY
jgi:predicted lipoprotein with Yx(FWY)xxD motif